MRHLGNNIYQCPKTLRRFRREVVWEYGTRTITYTPCD